MLHPHLDVLVRRIVFCVGPLFLSCQVAAQCTHPPSGWIDLAIADSETWPSLSRRILAMDIAPNGRGEQVLSVLQFVRTFGTHPFLARLNLDDPYRRWQVTQLPDGPADSGSNSAGHLLYAPESDDVWFIDRANVLQHFDGTNWHAVTELDLQRQGHIYGFGPDEIVVTAFGGSWIYNGLTWEDHSLTLLHPGGGDYGLWRNGPRDYFCVTAFGVFHRWQNGSITTIPTGSTKQITSVFGYAADDVFIIQYFGLDDPRIRHWNGATVTTVFDDPVPNDGKLWELVGLPDGTLVATGEGAAGGVILERNDGAWMCSTVSNTVWALAESGGHIAAAGEDAMVQYRGTLTTAWPRFYQGTLSGAVLRYRFKSSLRDTPSTFVVETAPTLGGTEWLPISPTMYQDGDYHQVVIFISPTWTERAYRVVEVPGPY